MLSGNNYMGKHFWEDYSTTLHTPATKAAWVIVSVAVHAEVKMLWERLSIPCALSTGEPLSWSCCGVSNVGTLTSLDDWD